MRMLFSKIAKCRHLWDQVAAEQGGETSHDMDDDSVKDDEGYFEGTPAHPEPCNDVVKEPETVDHLAEQFAQLDLGIDVSTLSGDERKELAMLLTDIASLEIQDKKDTATPLPSSIPKSFAQQFFKNTLWSMHGWDPQHIW